MHSIFYPDPPPDAARAADPDQHGSHRLSVHNTGRGCGEIHIRQTVRFQIYPLF